MTEDAKVAADVVPAVQLPPSGMLTVQHVQAATMKSGAGQLACGDVSGGKALPGTAVGMHGSSGSASAPTLPENLMDTGFTFWPMRRMLVLSPGRPAFTFSGYTPSCRQRGSAKQTR